jgi:hypothetical protein
MSVRALRRGLMAGRGAAAAAIAFRASSLVSIANSAGTTDTITIPAAVAVGDLMLAAVAIFSGDTLTTPSGWTLAGSAVGTSDFGQVRLHILWRIATAGNVGGAATVPFVFSGGRRNITFLAYSGVNATPINAQATGGSGSNGTPAVAPSVTTTVNGCLIVEAFGFRSTVGSVPEVVTGPATARGGAQDVWLGSTVSDQAQATAGATGTQSATAATAGGWVTYTIALAPA